MPLSNSWLTYPLDISPSDYLRKCEVRQVVDGDTLDLRIELAYCVLTDQRIRLVGVNAPEPRGETRQAGEAAATFVLDWVSKYETALEQFYVRSFKHKRGKYGRYPELDKVKGVVLFPGVLDPRVIDYGKHLLGFLRGYMRLDYES